MPKMLQVRNVPDKVHRELVRRARDSGKTLTAYVEELLENEVARPPAEEVYARIRSRTPVHLDVPIYKIVRRERATRDRP